MDSELTPEERELLAKDERDQRHFANWMQIILVLIGAAALTLAVQAFTWLRTGNWPLLSLKDAVEVMGVTPAQFSWVGLERIADFLWSLPLSGYLFALGLAAILWVTRGDHKETSEPLRQARMKQAKAIQRTE